MIRHEDNALKIVNFLSNHPKVSQIYYPGLTEHKNHNIANQQMTGFGGMLSFELEGGLEPGCEFIKHIKLWCLAESLGSVESMATHPASMTHASVPRDIRLARGISDGLIRLSVGIEDPNDLILDLQQALKNV